MRTERIGMYVSLGIMGAGLGVLIGSVIVLKIEARKRREEEALCKEVKPPEMKPVEDSWIEEEYVKPELTRLLPNSQEYQDHMVEEYGERLGSLIEDYQVPTWRLQMLEKGLVTLDALEELYFTRMGRGTPPITAYQNYFGRQPKPRLDDLVRLLDNDGRWQVLADPNASGDQLENATHLVWYDEDERLVEIMYNEIVEESIYYDQTLDQKRVDQTRSITEKQVDPTEIIGLDTLPRVIEFLEKTGQGEVYVEDTETEKLFLVEFRGRD